ncbi:MAG: hypothetical protein J6127_00740 [Clostridiales bacterium]|nr:hypothetical protein [Clostridiales bacterium]
MLTYEEFKNTFSSKFPEVMGTDFQGYELKMIPVVKRGKNLDGFTFCPRERDGEISVMPTYYFNDIYEAYCSDEDMTRSLYEISCSMKKSMMAGQVMSHDIDFSKIKKNVIAELVNTERGTDYIYDIPHREFFDLTIVYRWVVKVDETGIYSSMIDNKLMETAGLTEEELYRNAMKNTKRIIPPKIKTFDSVIRKIMKDSGKSDYEIRKCLGSTPEHQRIYVLCNKHNFRASTAILFNDVLDAVAQKTGCSYYIVPTSVNESLAVPVLSGIEPLRLLEMLIDSNQHFTGDDDQILSDSIYYYDAEKSKLKLVDFGKVRI